MWKIIGWVAGIAVLVPVGFFALNLLTAPVKVANMALNSATGVIERTVDPNNVIVKYEWFHDAHGAFKARIPQIKATKAALADEKDANMRGSLRVELSAQQQNCRDIVTKYNANATKTNVSIFMGTTTPPSLNIEECN